MDIAKFAFGFETYDFVEATLENARIKRSIDDSGRPDVILNLIESISLNFNVKLYNILDKYTTLAFPSNTIWTVGKSGHKLETKFIITLNNVHGTNTETLILRNNLISDIKTPNLAAKFPVLNYLDLSVNNILSLVGVVFPPMLESLYLNDNNIATLEDVILPPVLTRLDLSGNKIKSILGIKWPDVLGYLNLNNNSISSITGVDFKHIYSLDLSRNLIDSIDGIEWSDDTQILNLEYNRITLLTNVLLPPNLQSLVIGGNGIKSFKNVKFPRSLAVLKFGPDTDISDLVLSGTGKNDTIYIKLDLAQYTMGFENFINNARWIYLSLSNLSLEDEQMLAQLVLDGLPYGNMDFMNDFMRSSTNEDQGVMILNTFKFDRIDLYLSLNKEYSDPAVIFDLINIAQVYNLSDLETINKILNMVKDEGISFVDAIKRLRTTTRTCRYSKLTQCSTFNIYVDEYNCCYAPDNDIILDYEPILEPKIRTGGQNNSFITTANDNYLLYNMRKYLRLYTHNGDRVLNGYYRTKSVTPSILEYVKENMSTFGDYGLDYYSSDNDIRDFILDYSEAIDTIFKNAPKVGPEGLIVYRGLLSDVPIARLPEGIIYSNTGIVSTSLSINVALEFTGGHSKDYSLLLAFYLPPGTKAIYMEKITMHGGEAEVILPNNSKFIVETNDVYTDSSYAGLISHTGVTINRSVHRLILD